LDWLSWFRFPKLPALLLKRDIRKRARSQLLRVQTVGRKSTWWLLLQKFLFVCGSDQYPADFLQKRYIPI